MEKVVLPSMWDSLRVKGSPFAWGKLPMRVRVLLIAGLATVSLLVAGALAGSAWRGQSAVSEELVQASLAERHQRDADLFVGELRARVYAAVLGESSGADAGNALAALRADAQDLRMSLEALAVLATSPALSESNARTRPIVEDYISTAVEIVGLAPRDSAGAANRLGELDRAHEQVRQVFSAQATLIQARVDSAKSAAGVARATARRDLAAAALLLVMLSVAVVWVLAISLRSYSHATRDTFRTQLIEGLEMVDTEPEVLATITRAMSEIAADRPMELLLTDGVRNKLSCAAEHARASGPRCAVESTAKCVAIARGHAVSFSDSEALNACPRMRGRACGPMSAVCIPVSSLGRTLGVLHVGGQVNALPNSEQLDQLTTLGNQAGMRIAVVRASGKGGAESDSLVDEVQRASAHG